MSDLHYKENDVLEYFDKETGELLAEVLLTEFKKHGLPFVKEEGLSEESQVTHSFERWNTLIIKSYAPKYRQGDVHTLNIPYLYKEGVSNSLDWKQSMSDTETILLIDKFLEVNGIEIF